ncbi:MAG TPA: tetratricopeptide repeat protein [Chloroflexia bacterium]
MSYPVNQASPADVSPLYADRVTTDSYFDGRLVRWVAVTAALLLFVVTALFWSKPGLIFGFALTSAARLPGLESTSLYEPEFSNFLLGPLLQVALHLVLFYLASFAVIGTIVVLVQAVLGMWRWPRSTVFLVAGIWVTTILIRAVSLVGSFVVGLFFSGVAGSLLLSLGFPWTSTGPRLVSAVGLGQFLALLTGLVLAGAVFNPALSCLQRLLFYPHLKKIPVERYLVASTLNWYKSLLPTLGVSIVLGSFLPPLAMFVVWVLAGAVAGGLTASGHTRATEEAVHWSSGLAPEAVGAAQPHAQQLRLIAGKSLAAGLASILLLMQAGATLRWVYEATHPAGIPTFAIELTDIGSAYNQGVGYQDKGDDILALACYNQAATYSDTHQSWALNNRGLVYYSMGKYRRAIADYDKAISADVLFPLPHANRALAYYALGEYERAIEDATYFINGDSSDSRVWNTRAISYYAKGRYSVALADLDQALEWIEGEPPGMLALVYSNRGLVYTALKEYDKAVASLDLAISINPDLDLAYYNRARAKALQGKLDEAVADFKKTLELTEAEDIARYARKMLFLLGKD